MKTLADLVIGALHEIGAPDYPIYEQVLRHAVTSEPPPFAQNWFGRRYYELATKADWFANSLVANAALEGYGSRQIWKFANNVTNPAYVPAIRKHSLDESRHSTMFVTMLKLTFPGATIDSASEEAIADLQPHFSAKNHPATDPLPDRKMWSGDELLNELIQVHITEIRALVLQYLLRPTLLAYGAGPSQKRLDALSRSLIRDEARHIEYTAKIFESTADTGSKDFLFETFTSRLRDFNELTMVELGRDTIAV